MSKYLSSEELISMPNYSEPRVSPDGRRVAWGEHSTWWKEQEFRRHVWVYDRQTGQSQQVTSGEQQSFAPAWSPDGKWLSWLAPVGKDDDKADQLFIADVKEFRPVQVSFAKHGVKKPLWHPDGKVVYYLAPDSEQKEQLKKRKDTLADFEDVDRDYVYSCIFSMDLEQGLSRGRGVHQPPPKDEDELPDPSTQLTKPDTGHVTGLAVSKEHLAFTVAKSPNMTDIDRQDLCLLDLADESLRRLESGRDMNSDLAFSPCGKKLCYSRPINEETFYNITTLEIRRLEDNSTFQPVADKFDESVTPSQWTDKGILAVWQQGPHFYPGFIQEDGAMTPLVEDEDCTCLFACAANPKGTALAAIRGSSTQPMDLWLDDIRITGKAEKTADRPMAKRELVSWASSDGTPIEGILITAPDLDRSKPHPLIALVHGGPTWTALRVAAIDRLYPVEELIEKGFIILDVNYRGSTGYGDAFRKLNYRNLGLGDIEDVLSGVDMLVEEGLASPDNVGIMGWSQGGYISAMATTYASDRFVAASVGAGITNWITYYANTDIHQFTRIYLGDTPWNDPDIYAKTSPMTYIKQAKTPTLIQHGEKDGRVPTPNALELYQGLEDMEVPVRLVLFKGMAHGPEKPGQVLAIAKQNLAWFSHHMLGEDLKENWPE